MSSGALPPSVSLSMSAVPSVFGSNRPPPSCGCTETNSEHRGGSGNLAGRNHRYCCERLVVPRLFFALNFLNAEVIEQTGSRKAANSVQFRVLVASVATCLVALKSHLDRRPRH